MIILLKDAVKRMHKLTFNEIRPYWSNKIYYIIHSQLYVFDLKYYEVVISHFINLCSFTQSYTKNKRKIYDKLIFYMDALMFMTHVTLNS